MITAKENMRRVITGDGDPEWMPVASQDFDIVYPSVLQERPPFGQDGIDWYGVSWVFDKGFNSFFQDMNVPLVCDDITKWREQIHLPDYSRYNFAAAAERDLKGHDRENKFLRLFLECGAWERLHSLVGFEQAFIYMYDEPEEFKALMQAITDNREQLIRILKATYDMDAVFDMNDLGSAKTSFLSPSMYREYIQPYQKQLVDVCHELGVFYIMHSCGTVDNLFGDMIATGCDIINPIQGCNDWEYLRDNYLGKVVFEGARNLRCEDVDATEEFIRTDIRKGIDMFAPGKKFIFDDYCMLPRNQEIMVDEATKYGKKYFA
ncbi:MAG: uroporphyrinogen decarboxylase family protein [Lachnospiraceae bacterium]|nr:uroporphyrinogen decarboxylase family protein [Lachnospiraceae bacterium]